MPKIVRLKDKHTKLQSDYQHINQSDKYYNTKQWKELRVEYKRNHPLCEECLSNGIIKPTEHIHHKIEFLKGNTEAERERLLLDPNNLEALCLECHRKKHGG